MRVEDIRNATYLKALAGEVTRGDFKIVSHYEWLELGGLDELRSKLDVYMPACVEAVSKLRTDLVYIDKDCKCLTFSGLVKVFPNDVTEFAFTKRWWRPYIWLRPSEVYSLKLTPDSIVKVAQEAAGRASSRTAWWKGEVEV